MGCDIHMYAEAMLNGRWTFIPGRALKPLEGLTHLSMLAKIKITGIADWWETKDDWDTDYLPQNRDYDLFAKLADVRNYDGDKPWKESENFIPDNCSPQVQRLHKTGAMDWHSEVTYSLAELEAIDWEKDWKHSYKPDLQISIIPALVSLKNELQCSSDEIRIVMWFDN